MIGAGMAGLACAGAMHAAGWDVTVFDKGRRAGGRLATRRADGLQFDHGAAYASARGPAFQAVLDSMGASGDAAPWTAAGPDRWAGTPGMSALARHMEGRGVGTVHTMRHAAHLERQAAGWMVRHHDAATAAPGLVTDTGGEVAGPFEAVLLAVPAPQAAGLLRAVPHRFAAEAGRAGMAPCWALMAGFAGPSGAPDVLCPGGPLTWIARDTSRPGRAAAPECWVAHASAEWSWTHLEDSAETVRTALLQAFASATGLQGTPAYASVHRWRYALADSPLGVPALWDREAGLGVCGDWCLGARIESAYDSGCALAGMAGA